jgi:hypothetical protein
MTPTRPSLLLALALIAFGSGVLLVLLVEAAANRLLLVPWGAALAMGMVALAVLGWALLARPRLLHRPGHPPLDPILAARTAALAMAGSRTGAAVTGFYLGAAGALLPAADTEAGRSSAGAAAATAAAGAVLAVVALWLEGMCRLPGDDDRTTPGTPGASGGGASEGGGSGPEPVRSTAGPHHGDRRPEPRHRRPEPRHRRPEPRRPRAGP